MEIKIRQCTHLYKLKLLIKVHNFTTATNNI